MCISSTPCLDSWRRPNVGARPHRTGSVHVRWETRETCRSPTASRTACCCWGRCTTSQRRPNGCGRSGRATGCSDPVACWLLQRFRATRQRWMVLPGISLQTLLSPGLCSNTWSMGNTETRRTSGSTSPRRISIARMSCKPRSCRRALTAKWCSGSKVLDGSCPTSTNARPRPENGKTCSASRAPSRGKRPLSDSVRICWQWALRSERRLLIAQLPNQALQQTAGHD